MVQLILPLNMNQLVMYNSKTIGRDKLARWVPYSSLNVDLNVFYVVSILNFYSRLIQYASKLTWHILKQCNANGTSVSKIKELEYILGNFRKCKNNFEVNMSQLIIVIELKPHKSMNIEAFTVSGGKEVVLLMF